MPPASSNDSPSSASWRRDVLLLVLAFGALYFFRLGSCPFSNPDEGRNAEIAREMLASGDWVTPRLNGVNYFEKPPLVYWVTAVMERTFGESEWSVRAVPALFAIFGVLLTYGAGRALHGRNAGLLAAIVLGTSLLWFVIGHIPILDMAVSVFMGAALFAFILGVRAPPSARRRWFFHGLYASMALATLAKGLMGFLVTGAVMFLWLLVFDQWKRLRPLYLPTGALLFLAIAAPWHVLAALRNETWVHRYIVFEHWQRFTTNAASRVQPWYFFIGIILAGLIPWTGFLWPAMRDAVRGGWTQRRGNADAWFFVTWIAFIFFFFSVSHSKLAPYILPIFPALALLIGAWLAKALEENAAARLRWPLRVFTFVNGVLAVAFLMAVLKPGLLIRDPMQALALQLPAFAMAAALMIGGIFVPWLARIRGVKQALVGIVAATAAFLAAVQTADLPAVLKPGTKPLAEFVRAHAKPGDRVMHYFDFFHDFTFYAKRTVELIGGEQSVSRREFSELEFMEDAAAMARGQLMTETTFREIWLQPTRIFVVTKKRDVREKRTDGKPPLFSDPTFRYHLLAESRDHYLFSNQP